MDPVTIWILCLATAVIIKNLAVDGWARLNGREPPSIIARRARQELAQKQHVTTGTPGVVQATLDRLGDRIANPPPRRFWSEFRQYLDEVAADAVQDARTKHAEKRVVKRAAPTATPPQQPQPAPPPTPPPPVDDDIVDAEIVDDIRRCDTCGDELYDSEPGPQCEPCEGGDQVVPGDPTPPHGIPVVGPEPASAEQPPAPETSESAPGPDTTTEGTPTMTQSTVIDGDIHDPTGAHRFTVANAATLRAVADQYELMIARARAGKLGDAAVRELELIRADILACVGTVDQATAEFAKHVALQANIASNDDLKGTVAGTYTDGNRAS